MNDQTPWLKLIPKDLRVDKWWGSGQKPWLCAEGIQAHFDLDEVKSLRLTAHPDPEPGAILQECYMHGTSDEDWEGWNDEPSTYRTTPYGDWLASQGYHPLYITVEFKV